ncbi:acyl-CoA dehydrogenase family protein [Nocardiopsis baichengensis]|uniref:acyl-CoA dehydrogenase family protein n=1 Tax=Nocardiopsis baichengensis TaxID=280240 RepID=UPI000348A3FE|nr:acyl-CoA dehydrogenase family protein [Nocardiopsis baichengensis]
MYIDLTDDQRRLRDELRAYFARAVDDEERERAADDPAVYKRVVRRLGGDGMLALGWPEEYGGRGLGPLEQQIFVNEASRAGVPYPLVTLQTVAPVILRRGTPEQRARFLPPILAGELHFAIGYTEPEAGTDLAALRTTAAPDGQGGYTVDGSKLYTSGAHFADHIWLAARTGEPGSRHRGITLLIADTADPGFSWTPVTTADGHHHTNATYYSGVRVPPGRRIGDQGEGWRIIIEQLNHERLTLGPSGTIGRTYDRFREWARTARGPGGRPPDEHPQVRRALARVHAYLRVNELLNWQVAAGIDSGWLGAPDASANKVYASERLQEVPRLVARTVARFGDPADPATADLAERMDTAAKGSLVMTFGGGVNEVQRELIATLGLGLPRAPR